MKLLITLLSLAIIPAQANSAELSKALLERLDNAFSASMVQLAMPDTCQDLKQGQKFKDLMGDGGARKDRIEYLKAAAKYEQDTQSYTWLAVAATGGAFYLRTQGLKSPLTFVPASMSSIIANDAGTKQKANLDAAKKLEHTQQILNAGQLDSYARELGEHAASIFSLNKGEESTVVAAIKADVTKRFNRRDNSEFNFYETLRGASFKGKPVLSPAKLAVLSQLEKGEAQKDEAKEWGAGDKIAAIVATNRFLDLCLERAAIGKERAIEMKKRSSRNLKLLEEIATFSTENHAAEKSAAGSDSDASLDAN